MTSPDVATHRTRRRITLAAIVAIIGIAVALLLRSCDTGPAVIRVVAAGNIACGLNDPNYNTGKGANGQCAQLATSNIAVALHPDYVIGLGNYQFEMPTAQAYTKVYGPSWGRLRTITYPAIGNQEYKVHAANTFRTYFVGRVPADQSYWSYDLGSWHIVMLDSNCTTVMGGCLQNSPQQVWLAHDLATHPNKCVMAVWHHARWSNGIAGRDERTRDLYKTLYNYNADVVLSSHDFDYERFTPLNPTAGSDPKRGVVQFVAGAGGQAHYVPTLGNAPWRAKRAPIKSAFADFTHQGVLELALNRASYSWKYYALGAKTHTNGATVAGAAVIDSGTTACH